MLPAGEYFVGDLCYVLSDRWEEVCKEFFAAPVDNEYFTLQDGIRFAMFETAYGDGGHYDQHGKEYGVDSGTLGCVLISDIKDTNITREKLLRLGNVIQFTNEFSVSSIEGVISFGAEEELIRIDTDTQEDDEDGSEYGISLIERHEQGVCSIDCEYCQEENEESTELE